MVHKNSLDLLIILLGFSFVLSSAAVPTTRSLVSNREETLIQTTLIQDEAEFRNGGEMLDKVAEELMLERRMDLESTDYPGTGANNHHDPKTPGRA